MNMKHAVKDSWFPIVSEHMDFSKFEVWTKWLLFSNPLTYCLSIPWLCQQQPLSFFLIIIIFSSSCFLCLSVNTGCSSHCDLLCSLTHIILPFCWCWRAFMYYELWINCIHCTTTYSSIQLRVLKHLRGYNIETYLTVAIELKLDEGTKLRWSEHSSKCEITPPCEELLEFLDAHSWYHESVSHSARLVPKAAPRSAYAAGSDNAFRAGGRGAAGTAMAVLDFSDRLICPRPEPYQYFRIRVIRPKPV